MGTHAATLKAHLQRHEDKFDDELERHRRLLVGENENDGLCKEVSDMQKTMDTFKKDFRLLDDGFKSLGRKVMWSALGIVFVIIGEYLLNRFVK